MLEPFHSGHIIVYCCAVFGLLQVHCPVVNVKEQAVLACDWWIGIPGEHPCCSCLRARLFTMLGKCLVCFCNLNKVLWRQSFYWSSRDPIIVKIRNHHNTAPSRAPCLQLTGQWVCYSQLFVGEEELNTHCIVSSYLDYRTISERKASVFSGLNADQESATPSFVWI